MDKKRIGVFDSGVGGISVLKEAIKYLPNEKFIYFGDNINSPYGDRTEEEIFDLTEKAVGFLLSKDIKALLIACNTATSAAVSKLREKLGIPVIGMEPAIKTAVKSDSVEKIYVMATEATLRLKKFSNLISTLENSGEIIPVSCSGLVELIESGIIDGQILKEYIEKIFEPYKFDGNSAIVLGCTHYIFIKDFLKKYFEEKNFEEKNSGGHPIRIEIIDGNLGTIKQLARKLEETKSIDKKPLVEKLSGNDYEILNGDLSPIFVNENVEILSSDTTEKTKDVYLKLFGGVEYETGRQRL